MRAGLRGASRQQGQSLPEYVVGVLALMAAFFTPIPAMDNQSAAEFLVESFQKNYRGYEYVLSQPAGE